MVTNITRVMDVNISHFVVFLLHDIAINTNDTFVENQPYTKIKTFGKVNKEECFSVEKRYYSFYD